MVGWGVGLPSSCKREGVWFHQNRTEAYMKPFIFCKIVFLLLENPREKWPLWKAVQGPHSPADSLHLTSSSKLTATFLSATLHVLLPLLCVLTEVGEVLSPTTGLLVYLLWHVFPFWWILPSSLWMDGEQCYWQSKVLEGALYKNINRRNPFGISFQLEEHVGFQVSVFPTFTKI